MYEAKKYDDLLGMEGFSDNLLNTHFKLYEGYVANVNKLSDVLDALELGTPEYSELKRRFGWEWNGMRLHELYFSNLKKNSDDLSMGSVIAKKISEEFGSFEKWKESFAGIGMMRGIGWVVLCYDKEGDRLFNIWIGEHDLGHLSGAAPLLIMDVFEHAFVLDYGMNRKDYINSFMNNINWEEVENRFT